MSDQTRLPPERRAGMRRRGLLGLGIVVLAGGLAVLYGTGRIGKNGSAACADATAAVARLEPLVHGEIAALALAKPPRLMSDLTFKDADGQARSLADFKGKTVLLNLWATWCVPCRKEMPALDRLQGKLGSPAFQVVALNIDTARLERPKAFLHDTGVTHLELYTDPTASAFQVLRQDGQALGLPTTLLIGPNGCQLGQMSGPAEWDSPEAEALIAAAKS